MTSNERIILSEYVDLFACPDDKHPLKINSNYFQCTSCQRKYPIFNDTIVDLVPSTQHLKPLTDTSPKSSKSYWVDSFYNKEVNTPFSLTEKTETPFGEVDDSSRCSRNFVNIYKNFLLKQKNYSLGRFIDISASAGAFTLGNSRNAELIVHCDLSRKAINSAYRKARNLNINNIIFVRCDYMSLPFSSALDTVICLDSLNYFGLENDINTVAEMQRILRKGGSAMFDVHPQKRFSKGNPRIVEYSLNDCKKLQKKFAKCQVEPFGRIPARLLFHPLIWILNPLFFWFDPVRYFFTLSHENN